MGGAAGEEWETSCEVASDSVTVFYTTSSKKFSKNFKLSFSKIVFWHFKRGKKKSSFQFMTKYPEDSASLV